MFPQVLAFVSLLFLAAPLFIIVPMSFSTAISFQFPPPGYWLGYYERYFSDSQWIDATINSTIIAFGSMLLTLIVVLPASFAFVRYRFRGKTPVNLLLMLPLIVPHVVSALAYYGFLGQLRLTDSYLGVALAHGVLGVPVTFLVISAALKGFDRNLERAAMNAGAGPLRTFFYVTLPVLKPGIMIGALFAFLQSFNESVVAIFITGRKAVTLPKKMFESIRLESDPVIAVISTMLIGAVLTGVLISMYVKSRSQNKSYGSRQI
jgi:putative spermidine/putrescine transport system permease protein